jgi:alpha-ketoglutarate-dependent taurine dioxygenase
MVRVQPLSPHFGAIVEPVPGPGGIDQLSSASVVDLYKRFGAVLFRGFRTDVDVFRVFTDRFTEAFVVNGNLTREAASPDVTIQTVNVGSALIPMHSEMAYGPLRPDLLWFFCEVPAARNGETMLCDGVDVWARLVPSVRAVFLENKVKYTFKRVPVETLSLVLGEAATSTRIRELLGSITGLSGKLYHDGTVDLDYVVSAVVTPKHCQSPAFANSVIVEGDRVVFESGVPMSRDLRLSLFQVTTSAAFMLKWKAGDVLMIDNSRIMHGRCPFPLGDRRRILIRMGRETFR